MEGLVILVLLGWFISGLSKNKKPKGRRKTAAMFHKPERQTETAPPPVFSFEESKVSFETGEGENGVVPPSMEGVFRGSMAYDSNEGECVCDPELAHGPNEEIEPESVYSNEIGHESLTDFSARGLLQGIVMNEILTRPDQRMKRFSNR